VRERLGLDPGVQDFSGYLDALKEEVELKLMKKTLLMKDELIDITHHYYNHHRIIGSQEETLKGRLALLKGVRTVLRLSLKLIGVSAPERM